MVTTDSDYVIIPASISYYEKEKECIKCHKTERYINIETNKCSNCDRNEKAKLTRRKCNMS